jgi:single-stranded-DNA-specific exonuclease
MTNPRSLPNGFQFSQGSLKDYRDCPRRFELKYIEQRAWPALISEPAMEFERRMLQGAAFHRLVQQHLAGMQPEQVEAALINTFKPGADEELLEWWQAYLTSKPAELPGQRLVEYPLTARIDGQRIFARLDVLVIQPDACGPRGTKAVILDWKTSRLIKREFLAASLQTRVYRCLAACCTAELNSGTPIVPENIEMVYWFTQPGSSPVRFGYNDELYREDRAMLGGLMAEISSIPAGNFLHTTNLKTCEYCVYRSLCGRGVRAAGLEEDEVEEEEAAPSLLEVGPIVSATKIRLQKYPVWSVTPQIEVNPGILEAAGGNSMVAQILTRRGMRSREEALAFLDPDLYRPASPWDMPGMDALVTRLEKAIRLGETICVWGDFDVDGQTSTTVLVDTLTRLGGRVIYHIPVRDTESHGVNIPELEKVIATGAQVVLTCDTGITALEAAAYTRACGVDFLISDHHVPPKDLPDAYAMVNPHFLPPGHGLRGLPGVGIAWLVASALANRLGKPELADEQLDLVALGIVADVAEQYGDTRWLLQRGLKALQQSRRPGLLALCETAGVNAAHITEETIGFMLGPRLNAIGRLADANPIVEFLTTTDDLRASLLASELEALNSKRRLLVAQVSQAAMAQVEADPSYQNDLVLVLAHPDWPAGVAGIAASRLVDLYGKPAILLCTPEGKPGRGSARSITGVDINQAISACGSLLAGFGGHPMAAGLAIPVENIPAFRRQVNRAVEEQTGGKLAERVLALDLELPLEQAQLALVEAVDQLAPFGQGNPGPVFYACGVTIEAATPVGKNHEHLQLILKSLAGTSARAIWWGGADRAEGITSGTYDIAYRLHKQDYRGSAQVQIEWVDARQAEQPKLPAKKLDQGRILINLRRCANPHRELEARLAERSQVQVWREGTKEPTGVDRFDLKKGPVLCIWSAPPGPDELEAALHAVSPEEILIFGIRSETDSVDAFLNSLRELVTANASNNGAKINSQNLAGRTGQRLAAVNLGLIYLQATGVIASDALEPGLARGNLDGQPESVEGILRRLAAVLEETSAYRQLFRLLPLASLMPAPEKISTDKTKRR